MHRTGVRGTSHQSAPITAASTATTSSARPAFGPSRLRSVLGGFAVEGQLAADAAEVVGRFLIFALAAGRVRLIDVHRAHRILGHSAPPQSVAASKPSGRTRPVVPEHYYDT